jgi:hypothetical protein
MSELSVRQTSYPPAPPARRPARPVSRQERVALVDLLDRVLAGGVVIAGEVTLSVADVDMVTISLRALITSAGALIRSDSTEPE